MSSTKGLDQVGAYKLSEFVESRLLRQFFSPRWCKLLKAFSWYSPVYVKRLLRLGRVSSLRGRAPTVRTHKLSDKCSSRINRLSISNSLQKTFSFLPCVLHMLIWFKERLFSAELFTRSLTSSVISSLIRGPIRPVPSGYFKFVKSKYKSMWRSHRARSFLPRDCTCKV